MVTALGGRGYSAEATSKNLSQLLKSLISQQQEKIILQDENVSCRDDYSVKTLHFCNSTNSRKF